MNKVSIDGERIFVIDDFLSSQECRRFIERSELEGYAEATIVTPAGAVMAKEIRDNARLILDDAELAADLWRRAREAIPAAIGGSQAKGLNERFRFYRYDVGQRFKLHFDGAFSRAGERSELTFMVYLNSDVEGGETKFYDDDAQLRCAIRPQAGRALVFVHKQLHEGAPVLKGRKYVLRTDVMYGLVA